MANDGDAFGPLARLGNHFQPFCLLLLRLTFGFQTAQSGYQHLHNIDKMVQNFRDWGIPHPLENVYISGWTELILGSLVMVGLGTRLFSVPLLGNFIVAIWAVSRGDIATAFKARDYQQAYNVILNDTAFPFAMFALVMFAVGPGKMSFDYLFRKRSKGRASFGKPA